LPPRSWACAGTAHDNTATTAALAINICFVFMVLVSSMSANHSRPSEEDYDPARRFLPCAFNEPACRGPPVRARLT